MTKKQFKKLLKDISDNVITKKLLTISNIPFYDSYDKESNDKTLRLTDTEVFKLVTALKQNSHITKLDLSYNNIGDQGAIALIEVATLKKINFAGNQITAIGAKALAESTLKTLSLRENLTNYTMDDRIQFQNMINSFCNNKTITNLDLSYSVIPDKMTAQLINKNTTIQILTTSRDLTDKALEFIGNNTTLKELNIYENTITELGAHYISKNSSLETLYIAKSNINDNGAKALNTHPSLQKLSLIDSNITKNGAKSFYGSNIEEVILFNGTKHSFISRSDLEQFKTNFYYAKEYKQTLLDELTDQNIDVSTIDESYLMGDNQDEE